MIATGGNPLGQGACLAAPSFLKIENFGPFMAPTWSPHVSPNLFFMNIHYCAQGCFIPNFRVLASTLTVNIGPQTIVKATVAIISP